MGGHEMEVANIYRFVGQKTNIDILSKLLDLPNNLYDNVESAKYGQKLTREKSGRNKKQTPRYFMV